MTQRSSREQGCPTETIEDKPIRSGVGNGSHLYRLDLEARSRKRGDQVRRETLEPHYLNARRILTG